MNKYNELLAKYNEVVKAKKEEKKESDWKKTDFTFEETTLLKEKMSLMYDMTRWVKYYNKIDGFAPDWGNEHQNKYGIYLTNKKVFIDFFYTSNFFIFSLSVSSQERAEQMLKEFGERIQKYY